MSELDILYWDTVTLFNRYIFDDETIWWMPTVLTGVHFILNRAKIIATYGEQASDNVMLNIRYKGNRYAPVIQGKKYLLPMEFRKLDPASAKKYITFSFGTDFDFIVNGKWPELKNIKGIIDDDVYLNYGGFFNYMNKNYDHVFAITGVAKFDLLPHFQLTAR